MLSSPVLATTSQAYEHTVLYRRFLAFLGDLRFLGGFWSRQVTAVLILDAAKHTSQQEGMLLNSAEAHGQDEVRGGPDSVHLIF